MAKTLALNGVLAALDTYALKRLGLAARRQVPRRVRAVGVPRNEKE
ncbi:hypothetical protein OG266_04290 [Streptomyces sp. NBC_00554]|nr:hypothetical protein OG266_04290 [Streptomyces sp. NBC_00554]